MGVFIGSYVASELWVLFIASPQHSTEAFKTQLGVIHVWDLMKANNTL